MSKHESRAQVETWEQKLERGLALIAEASDEAEAQGVSRATLAARLMQSMGASVSVGG